MKIGDIARAALPRSDHGEQLASALEELQRQVNVITDIIASAQNVPLWSEPVTLETAAEDGNAPALVTV